MYLTIETKCQTCGKKNIYKWENNCKKIYLVKLAFFNSQNWKTVEKKTQVYLNTKHKEEDGMVGKEILQSQIFTVFGTTEKDDLI